MKQAERDAGMEQTPHSILPWKALKGGINRRNGAIYRYVWKDTATGYASLACQGYISKLGDTGNESVRKVVRTSAFILYLGRGGIAWELAGDKCVQTVLQMEFDILLGMGVNMHVSGTISPAGLGLVVFLGAVWLWARAERWRGSSASGSSPGRLFLAAKPRLGSTVLPPRPPAGCCRGRRR